VAGALLTAFATIVLGGHIRDGGFVQDDWWLQSLHSFPSQPGHLAGFENLRVAYWDRPALALYIATSQSLLGDHLTLHVAWTVALGVVLCTLLYAVLVMSGVGKSHALAIATLTLIFPAGDSALLWVTAGSYHWAMILFLAGLLMAFVGLASVRRSVRTALRVTSLALYLASVLTVEALAGPVAITALLYRLVGARWRRSLRWGALDMVAALGTITVLGVRTPRQVANLDAQRLHVRDIVGQSRDLVEQIALPDGEKRLSLWLILGVLTLALGVSRWLAEDHHLRQLLQRWVVTTLVGVAVVVAGYVVYIPAAAYYSPASPGIANRVNAIASPGFVVLFYGTLVLVATLLALLPIARQFSVAFTCLVTLALTITWAEHVRHDASSYDHSFEVQRRTLNLIKTRIAEPPPSAAVYTFGLPGSVARGVPIFAASWDLTGALRLLWRRGDVVGVPSTTVTEVKCGDTHVRPVGPLYSAATTRPALYGTAIFVQVPGEWIRRPADKRSCLETVGRLLPEKKFPPGVTPTPDQLAIAPWTLPSALVGLTYSSHLSAAGGNEPYVWAVDEPDVLPPGIALSTNGVISGSPTAAGTYAFVAVVTDAYGARGASKIFLNVRRAKDEGTMQ
jgi:hypothetical protein